MKETNPGIAIIGMSCRFPGAQDIREFWENILASRRQFRRIPDCRFPLADYFDPNARDKTYASRVAVMDWEDFDWEAYGISRATFEAADAVHWLALQVAMEAMADAGLEPGAVPGPRGAAFIGNTLCGEQTRTNGIRLRWPFIARALREASARAGMSGEAAARVVESTETVLKSVFPDLREDALLGSMSSSIVGRLSAHFGLGGGGYVVDGACASSLLAIATAADKLGRGELDLALAGGVDISLDPLEMIGFAGAHALTRGEMNVYDRRASGFIPGEGCGVIVLKRLADAERDGDRIYAVLRGWGISSDGRGAIAAPSSIGQSKAILRAYEKAGYAPRDLDFIEGHGTGTPVGDRAELEAVYSALRADRDAEPGSCGITSLKTLVGHMKAAAGIGGLMKATLAVNQRVVPPLAGCTSPHVLFEATAPRLYPLVQGEIRAATDRLRAGVSGMGFGGINCHITLESHGAPDPRLRPSIDTRQVLASAQESEVFLFGADSKAGLIAELDRVAADATDASIAELTDLAAQLARKIEGTNPTFRAAIVAQSPDALRGAIDKAKQAIAASEGEAPLQHISPDRRIWVRTANAPARVGMVFPGQGSQQINAGEILVRRHAWAAALVEDADTWMESIGAPRLSPRLFRNLARARKEVAETWRAELTETSVAQPAICVVSLLWARFLKDLGVQPAAVAGHSLGELSAFAVGGAFDARALITLAAQRGRAMSGAAGETGTMASLMCARDRAEAILSQVPGYAVIANINGPAQTVISGEVEAIEAAIRLAEAEAITTRVLPVSNAFHSRLVAGAADFLRAHSPVRGAPAALTTEIIAGATGTPVRPDLELSTHFAEQVLDQVDFVATIGAVARASDLIIEVGPGRVLSGMAAEALGPDGPLCLPIESSPGNDRDLNSVIAALFTHGLDLAWGRLYDGRLVRPFVPARERSFFTNPCERPFAPAVPAKTPPPVIVATGWTKSLGLPANTLQAYLRQRDAELGEMLRADLARLDDSSAPEAPIRPHPSEVASAPQASAATAARASAVAVLERPRLPAAPPAAASPAAAAPTLLRSVLPDAPASDAVAPAAHEPARAAPEEAALESHPSAIARQDAQIEGEIRKTLADRLEVPEEAISVDARLTDDLCLPLVDAIEVVEDIAEISEVPGMIDAAAFVHSTIHELAIAIRRARQIRNPLPRAPRAIAPRPSSGQADTRTFVVEAPVIAPLPALPPGETSAEDWNSARAVILADAEREHPHAAALAAALKARGAAVFVLPFSAAPGLERSRFSHVFALLPRPGTPSGHDPREALRAAVHRLGAAARASTDPTRFGRARKNALVLVQFGGGMLAPPSGFSPPEHGGLLGFAATLHRERPLHRIRAVDLADSCPPTQAAAQLLAEVEAPGDWIAAGYDQCLVRRVRRLRPSTIEAAGRTALTWPKGGVLLVTGGAEGVAAECALAFASATGMRVGILSRPDETAAPDPARRVIIERNLARYRAAGLPVQHHVLDLRDEGAVRDACARVSAELGPIAAVIHGDAEVEPGLYTERDPEGAVRTIAPQVLGASNLIAALAAHPVRLFVSLASSAGPVGLGADAWCAIGNELTLGLFQAAARRRPGESSALGVAFDVWSPIGMGGTTGAITAYNRLGNRAIPPAVGARLFTDLLLAAPGAADVPERVVITARPDEVSSV